MCGIAGFYGKEHVPDERVRAALVAMRTRGPDYHAWRRYTGHGVQVVLAHVRLSIIDLDPRSHQPFEKERGSIIFNGEIYNYRELVPTLERRGVDFRTSSDTEVLFEALAHDGPRALDGCEGMWSFAYLDKESFTLRLSRDRFGEKPLYLYRAPEGMYFASELPALEAISGREFQPNLLQLKRYLVTGYRSLFKASEGYLREVEEVPPATVASWSPDGSSREERYWVPKVQTDSGRPLASTIEQFRELFIRSLELRLRADVPLAFCLSGGVDSNAICASAAKVLGASVATFSIIDRDPRYDESANILRAVASIGSDHTSIEISTDGFFERLTRQIAYRAAPVATLSYYVHALLSEAIAEHGFKVVLAGTGADEMLSGYYDHFLFHLYDCRSGSHYADHLSAWERYIKPLVRNPLMRDPSVFLREPSFRGQIYLDAELFNECLVDPIDTGFAEDYYADSLLLNRMMNEMFHEVVPVILREDDQNSMMFSIENRSPFLDRALYEFTLTIPPEQFIQKGYGKYILRAAMEGIVDDAIRLDRQKRGFNASLNSLVDFSDDATRRALLADSPVFELVRREKIASLFSDAPLSNSHSKFLFNFINAKLFLERRSSRHISEVR